MNDALHTWLGPAADKLSSEQIETVRAQAQLIDAHWPDPDEADLRDAALGAVVQVLLGDVTPATVAQDLATTRQAAAIAFAAAKGAGLVLVAQGAKKMAAARAVGIDRMSLLDVLGERR